MYIDNWTEEEHSRLIELLKNNPIIKGNYLHEDGIPAEDINKYVDTNAVEALTEILTNFHAEVEKARFEKIAEGGADAILANVKEQMPLIMKRERANIERAEKDTGQDLSKLKNFTPEDAANILLRELSLHVSAISGQEEVQQQFVALLIGYINKSKAIDGKVNEYLKKAIEEAILTPVRGLQERRKALPAIKTYGLMNDKSVAQMIEEDGGIFQLEADGQLALRWIVDQSGKKEETFNIYIALAYEGEDLHISKKLTAFDKQVYEAVGTLFHYCRQDNPNSALYITPQDIWRTMNGKNASDTNARPSDKRIKRICDSMEKMQYTRFYMDITDEMQKRKYTFKDERITEGKIKTYLLKCDCISFKTEKGRVLEGYKITEEPILYTYNRIKDRLLYVPFEMLDTSDYISDTENVAEFKGYLMQQIQLMMNAKEAGKEGKKKGYFQRNNTILINSIYESTGIATPEERITADKYPDKKDRSNAIRKLKKQDREKIEGILTSWTVKKWIKTFKPVKEGQQIAGYEIII